MPIAVSTKVSSYEDMEMTLAISFSCNITFTFTRIYIYYFGPQMGLVKPGYISFVVLSILMLEAAVYNRKQFMELAVVKKRNAGYEIMVALQIAWQPLWFGKTKN